MSKCDGDHPSAAESGSLRWPCAACYRCRRVGAWSMAQRGLALGAIASACQQPSAFICTSDDDCTDAGDVGSCEPTGFCSFPDGDCASMQRYGKHAGDLAGQCVPLDGDTDLASTTGSVAGTTVMVDDSGPVDGTTTAVTTASATSDGGSTIEFTDDDEQDFTAGTLRGLAWLDGGVQLGGGDSGVLLSRVFDAGESVSWQSLRWTPRAPYGKPLPGGEQSERGYTEGNADMSANLLLLHLDGQGTAMPGALLPDSSGQGHDFLLESVNGLPWVDGPFGAALADDAASYAHNGVWVDAFSFGNDDFSWSLWARSDSGCTGVSEGDNQVYLGIEGPGQDRSHLWLGCRNPVSNDCSSQGVGQGRPGGTYEPNASGDSLRVCGTSEVADDQWHHLAVTKLGHARSVVTLYFDGEVQDVDGEFLGAPIGFPFGTELALGAFSNGSFAAAVTLDEVAIWRRALESSEILGLYRRGIRRLSVSVRSCDDPECVSGGEMVGPDGSSGTAFVDVADALGPGSVMELPAGLEGRYFQYQVVLEGTPSLSPVLEAVTIEAQL